MAWTPEHKATDVRAILGNLLAYFASNQVAALAWASPSVLLTPLTFYPTSEVLIKTDFPHAGCVKRRVTVTLGESVNTITYDLTWQLETAVEHTKATRTAKLLELQRDTDNYGLALESMFLNIPHATVLTGIADTMIEALAVTSSDPLEVAVSETKSVFNVQMAVTLQMTQSVYE
jgi:hypothetical protein